MKKLTRYCIYLIFAMVTLGGCGSTAKVLSEERDADILDCTGITDNEIIIPDYEINISSIPKIEEEECSLSEIAYEDKLYYVLEYSHDGAQYAYKYEIYEDNSGPATLLYSSDNIVWLNEFAIHKNNLFWVEFSAENDHFNYSIIRFDLDAKSKTCLAEYSSLEVSELLLTTGDGYLAWYENYGSDVKLQYYDIKNRKKYSYDDKNIVVTSAYDRPEIVDSSIAFFAEKNGIKSCVNLQLKTHKEKETVVIKDCKYAGYALNGTIIAWFTNYINGEYYYYDVNKDEISQIVYPKGINVFSLHSDKNAVYFNMRGEANYLFVIDNDRTVKKMQFPDAYSGTHFGRNKYGSYIKVEGPNMVGIKSFY